MSGISNVIFGASAYPRKIEDDPMFNAWNRWLPRLWYLDQRQATRLDAESLYGASQYAILFSRVEFEEDLPSVTESVVMTRTGWGMTQITVLPDVMESVTRQVDLIRPFTTALSIAETMVLSGREPISVALTAGFTGFSKLHLSYRAGQGVTTDYEIQTSTNGTTWAAWGNSTSGEIDWVTTVPGYMRVRALSPGWTSAWVTVGPVTPPPPLPPISVALTPAGAGSGNLRFTWAFPGGVLTNYEIQTSTNGITWTAWGNSMSGDVYWATNVAGYMRVRSLSVSGSSTWVQAGPVTPSLPLVPESVSLAPSGAPGAGMLQLTWARPAGIVTDYEVQITNADYPSWTSIGATAVTTSTWGPTNKATAFRVQSRAPTGVSGWVTTDAVSPTLPLIPASVSVSWTGTRYSIHLAWAYPGGTVTTYEIEGYDFLTSPLGVYSPLGTDATGSFNWGSMSGRGMFRIRSVAPGGVSNWVTTDPVNDSTGPASPAISVYDYTGSNLGKIFTLIWGAWEDAQSGNSYSFLQVSYNSGGWMTVAKDGEAASQTPGAHSGAFTIPDAYRGQTVSWRLVTVDTWGNSTNGPATAVRGTKPKGTFYALATGVDTYTWGEVNAWRGFWIPYSDSQPSAGLWFYGDRWQAITKGFAPDAASIFMPKSGSDAAEQGTHDLQLVTNKVNDGVAPGGVGGGITGPLMGTDGQGVDFALPESFYVPMGIGNAFGIMLIDSGGPRRLYGTNLNSNSGRITFVFY